MGAIILGIVYAMLLLVNFIINLKREQLDNNKRERRASGNKTRASRFNNNSNN